MKTVMKGASKLIVSRKEIDLSKTLLMGQAFRWIQVEPDVFRGVIGDQMFHLSQQNDLIEFQSYKNMELYDCKETEDILKDYLGLNEKYEMSDDEHFKKIMSQTGCGIRLLKQNKVETLFAFICSSNNNIKVMVIQ